MARGLTRLLKQDIEDGSGHEAFEALELATSRESFVQAVESEVPIWTCYMKSEEYLFKSIAKPRKSSGLNAHLPSR